MNTYWVGLLCERVHEDSEQLIGVVDLLRVLPDDPDKRRLGFWLVQFVKVRAQCRNDAFVRGRVFPEDILT